MLLGTLSNLPGAGKYAGALSEVVATLTLAAPSASADELKESGTGSGEPSSTALASDSRGALTADTDAAQNRSGLVEIPSFPPEWCAKFGKGTSCVLLTRGPLFLTDARASAPDCEGQFLAIVAGGQVTVELNSPLMIHGGRILVPTDAALVLGQRPEPPKERESSVKMPAKESDRVILDDVSPEWSCPLYWSGFVPYDTTAQTRSPSPVSHSQ